MFLNKKDDFIGANEDNLIFQEKGRVKQIKKLNLKKGAIMAGDGWADYEAKKYKAVNRFIAFTENIHRDNIVNVTDFNASNFDEVIEYCKKYHK